jgi:ligand-binding sensor domain-containing protein/signal transduction histidine kinase
MDRQREEQCPWAGTIEVRRHRKNPGAREPVWRFALAGVAALHLWQASPALGLDPAQSIFQFNCQNWTRQNGLPADKINAITQTKDGYLWLATRNGLVRFDGLDFKSVPIALPKARGHDVRTLAPSRDGGFWFGIHIGSFGHFDGRGFSPIGDERLSGLDVGMDALMEARDGALWLGNNSELYRWGKGESSRNLAADGMVGAVAAFCEGPTGRIWIGTAERGLYFWDDGKLVPFHDEPMMRRNIFALTVDPNQRLWVGTSDGLFCCVTDGKAKPEAWLGNEVRALLVDRHGVLWVGTTGMGLARFKDGQVSFLKKADGLGSDNVIALFEDVEGSLWVGTRNGLSQLSDIKFPIISDRDGIAAGSCHSVAATTNNGILIAADTGLSQVSGGTGAICGATSALPNKYLKLAFQARNGEVYAEDGDKVINIISGDRIRLRLTNSIWADAFTEDAESVLVGIGKILYRVQAGELHPYQYQNDSGPDYYWINDLSVGKDGAIWVACNNGLFRVQNGTVNHWPTGDNLAGNSVLWVCEDIDGIIWAGLATGLARIKDGQIKITRTEDGLPDDRIYSIVPDDFGFLWCDSSRGIFRVSRARMNDFADGKARRIECQMYDGLESVRFADRTDQEDSGCKSSDGRIWFPGPWGVITIDPSHIPTNQVAPPIHIRRVLANGREFGVQKAITVPPGKDELQIEYAALSFIAPQKLHFRYRLDGFDKDWVEAEGRRLAFYANLKPGRYTFHVIAANADGVWNKAGDSIEIELRPRFYQTYWFYLIEAVSFIAVLAVIYSWRLRQLGQRHRALQAARDLLEAEVQHRTAELASANMSLKTTAAELSQRTAALEAEIEERKRMELELEQTHRRLLETSWRAGMAEVASNVLHNVGNVLNSVNISAGLVSDRVKHSKGAGLAKVVDLLREHQGDLESFLAHDPRGKMVPDYLSQLSEHIKADETVNIKELDSMCGHIEHIKEIVAMQQSYAKVSGVKEGVTAAELVENSLQINAGAFQRSGVKIIREYEPAPIINVEKHKVLQILVNLLRNALDACAASGNAEQQLILRISSHNNGVRIAVSDNGVGISPENLTRIFSHGFTTKKNGHGFGLHNGALAAKEIGGSLTAHSEGLGKGATFILELPI